MSFIADNLFIVTGGPGAVMLYRYNPVVFFSAMAGDLRDRCGPRRSLGACAKRLRADA